MMTGKKRPSIDDHVRKYNPETRTLFEKRGIFQSRVSADDYVLLRLGHRVPSEEQRTREMFDKARQLIKEKGFGLPADHSSEVIKGWAASIHAACVSSLDPAALAANFVGFLLVTRNQIDDATISPDAKFDQIIAFAAAWHAFHFEVYDEHKAAFVKTQHTAGQKKGSSTGADNKARRHAIIRDEIRKRGGMAGKQTSFIAKAIRVDVEAAFKRAGIALNRAQSKSTFQQMVRRAMPKD
jgi:hypothetical protein